MAIRAGGLDLPLVRHIDLDLDRGEVLARDVAHIVGRPALAQGGGVAVHDRDESGGIARTLCPHGADDGDNHCCRKQTSTRVDGGVSSHGEFLGTDQVGRYLEIQ